MTLLAVQEFLDDDERRAEALEHYKSQGFLVVADVFSADRIADMRRVWASIAAERQGRGARPNATLMMSHLFLSDVADIVRDRQLLSCVETVLGGRIKLIQSQLMFGSPGNKGFSPHQDNFYNQANPRDGIVAAWIAVEDTDRENGCLAVYPSSHLNGLVRTKRDILYLLSRSADVSKSLLRRFGNNNKPNDSGAIERYVYAQVGSAESSVDVAMRAGSVVFMHGDLIHFSHVNGTHDRSRRSLLTNFVRVGTTYASGRLKDRGEFDVYAKGATTLS